MIKKYILTFLISGTIITGIVISTKYVSPFLGAVLYAIPFEFLIIFFSLNSITKKIQLIKNSLISLTITLTFIIFFYTLMLLTKNFLISLFISIVVYIFLNLIYLKKVKNDF